MRPKKIEHLLVVLPLCFLAACGKQSTAPQSQTDTSQAKASRTAPEAKPAKQQSWSGPFGLASGISIEDLERIGFKTTDGSPDIWLGKPPRPMEGVDEYYVVAAPGIGLCRIRATVDISVVNGSGDQLKAKATQLAETMALKYGKHSTKVDYIGQDVYRRNPEYWMLGLKENSVLYAYDWSTGKTEQPLPDDLDNIEIAANALSTNSGYIAILYTYKNFKACKDSMKKKQATNL